VPLSAGTRLAQYEVIGLIGAGGMGEVYRAHDSRLGRDVALKVLPENVADDPDTRARFEHEARAVAAISHQSIMAIHELAVIEGRPVAVVELLEGESLRTRLSRGVMPWREAVQMAARIADGLAAAHAKGIVHRDLKPENIFITGEMRPKILDFGLAHSEPILASMAVTLATFAPTEPGRVMGTLGYMAPEQVRGEAVGAATDLFALGCTLAEMLTGDRPFVRATPADSLAAVLHAPPPDLLASGLDIPPRLAEVVRHCLEKDVAHRFGSASDVALALRALLSESNQSHSNLGSAKRRARTRSLAVLPFTALAADADTDYLADGITESIINSLSQLPKLRVVPRATVFAYKKRDVHPRSVGLALNVDSIVTGRVVQQGGLINIQAELVDVGRETQVWGDQYRYPLNDLMALQEQIAWQISEALRIRLTGQEKKRLKKRPTDDSDAYQHFMRGRHYWAKWSPDGFRAAVEHFQAAIDRDPSYARAYAGLSDTYGAMGYYGYLPPEVAMTRAAAAAYKALELDPQLADAHASMGMSRTLYYWDWIGAEQAFQRALALDARSPIAHVYYSLLLSVLGRNEEAVAHARRGRELDPLSLLMHVGVGWASYFARNYSDAAEAYRAAIAIDPNYSEALFMQAVTYERQGEFERAAASLGPATRLFGTRSPADMTAMLLAGFAAGGPAGYWRARLDMFRTLDPAGSLVPAYAYLVSHAQLNDRDRAFEILDRLVATRSGQAVFTGADPVLDPLRDDPRFDQILRRLALPSSIAPS
jgi:serine/threonine protein kinase/tetratricopeptide (TPR) repeat protein